ncbi:UPF0280 family protein, partial [Bacteroidota bacterium]
SLMYEPRFYRENMGHDRFKSFRVCCMETDLWIGINKKSYLAEMEGYIYEKIKELRLQVELYLKNDPKFFHSFSPVKALKNAPKICKDMAGASEKAGIGPKSSVAGAFSEYVGKEIEKKYSPEEIVIENGGDIYMKTNRELLLSVYAGDSPLSGKVGIKIPLEYSPLGVCTSSGTVGHSESFGKADALMLACKNTMLADALATAFGNKIKSEGDINPVLEEINQIPEVLSALIIKNDKMGISGKFELTIFE